MTPYLLIIQRIDEGNMHPRFFSGYFDLEISGIKQKILPFPPKFFILALSAAHGEKS